MILTDGDNNQKEIYKQRDGMEINWMWEAILGQDGDCGSLQEVVIFKACRCRNQKIKCRERVRERKESGMVSSFLA